MKKNSAKKLSLSRETLRSLEENQMLGVEGGARPQTRRPDCYTQYTYCGSCGIACTVDCVP
jgi:hypothetical protein